MIEVSAVIDSPAVVLYSLIADYRDGHPRIIPRPPFGDLTVERGGKGAGTAIRFTMTFFGVKRVLRAAITEPEPGRVLVETDLDNGTVTSFTVTPLSASRAEVRISTDLKGPTGFRGIVERALSARLLRPLYVRELALLAEAAKEGLRAGKE